MTNFRRFLLEKMRDIAKIGRDKAQNLVKCGTYGRPSIFDTGEDNIYLFDEDGFVSRRSERIRS